MNSPTIPCTMSAVPSWTRLKTWHPIPKPPAVKPADEPGL